MDFVWQMLSHFLAGCAGGAVAAVGVVLTNLGSLRDLMLNAQGGGLAFALLVFGFVLTFGSVAIGYAIMTVGNDQD
jgi:hypothetical protein